MNWPTWEEGKNCRFMQIFMYTWYPNSYYLGGWALMCDLGQDNKEMFTG